ncbi:MAG: cysteine synthase family protein [Armatimonadetes bacterium]|nr:cysteine synthase family protein [Armatimonadota bacterium]
MASRSSGLLGRIGHTPLLRAARLGGIPRGVEVLAKAEWFNPGGSVKDRPILRMIEDAERDGRLTPEQVLLDSTSGNAGIAYAMIGAAKGYRVELVLPENVSEERARIIRAYGAQIVTSDPLEGSDGAILLARARLAAAPERYFMLDQYNNPGNWRAHYEGTGPEIIAQSQGRLTHLVAGLGTSGTVMGVGRRLRETLPAVQIVAVEPDGPLHGLEGLKHMASSIVPGIYDPAVHHRVIPVQTEAAYAMTRRLAAEEGWLVGPSAGAAMTAALQVAGEVGEGVIVVILPDGGDRYLSTRVFG